MSVFRGAYYFSRKSSQYRRLCIRSLSSIEKCFFSNSSNAEDENTFSTIKSGIALTISLSFIYYKYFLLDRQNNHKNKTLFMPSVKALDDADGDKSFNSLRTKYNFLADVAEKTAPSVVYIEITARHPVSKKRIALSNGSGFIIKSDGLILTNAHVVAHYGHVIVKLYDGREFDGIIENQDTETDLATVRIKATNLPELPLGQSSKLRPGEFVIAMGNPLTLSHTITAGVVSSANRLGKELGLHKKSDYIQTDAAINIGNSGGPLVNLDGEAIGINTMKVTEGISFAIPSDRAVEFLNRIQEKQKRGWYKSDTKENKRKFLGITMVSLTPTLIQQLQERNAEFPSVQSGVLVWRVIAGSPAYEADIKPGDVILNINGTDVQNASDIFKMLSTENVLKIQIVRRRKSMVKVVTLIEPVTP